MYLIKFNFGIAFEIILQQSKCNKNRVVMSQRQFIDLENVLYSKYMQNSSSVNVIRLYNIL